MFSVIEFPKAKGFNLKGFKFQWKSMHCYGYVGIDNIANQSKLYVKV